MEKHQYKYKQYQLILSSDDQIFIDKKISAFGKWKSGSSDFVTNGVVYPIIGDGDFDATVKFLNNQASIDEAATLHFDVATKKEYANQFKKLEPKPEYPIREKK